MKKDNHNPNKVRYTFTELVDSASRGENEGFKGLLEVQREAIHNATANNESLHSLRGTTTYGQLKHIVGHTRFRLGKDYYSHLKCGKRWTCSITVLSALAHYWGYSLAEFIQEPAQFNRFVATHPPKQPAKV